MLCKIYSYFIQLTISTEAFPACNYKKFTRQYYLSSCTSHELQFITLYKKHYNKIKVQFLIKPIFGISSKFQLSAFVVWTHECNELLTEEERMIVLFGSSLSPRELAVCSSQRTFHSVFYKMWSIHVPCLHLRKRRVV